VGTTAPSTRMSNTYNRKEPQGSWASGRRLLELGGPHVNGRQ
jgi:hypothetical protein